MRFVDTTSVGPSNMDHPLPLPLLLPSMNPAGKKTHVACAHIGCKCHFCEHPGCDYYSHKRSDVKRHTFIHTGERPYPCRDKGGCTKSFKHPSTRCRHEQAKHGPMERFQCDVQGCLRSFSRKDNMWQHQKATHGAWDLINLPVLPQTAQQPLDVDAVIASSACFDYSF
jgi:growth factor independent 1